MRLTLKSRELGDVLVLKCCGRIVAGAEVQTLLQRVKQAIPETPDVVLQLAEVEFVDSSGLGALVRLAASTRAAGGDLKLCAPAGMVLSTLRMTGLERVFELHQSVEDAVAATYRRRKARALAGARIQRCLCVAESADVLAYIAELLRGAGHEVMSARNLADARVLCQAAKPGVIVTHSLLCSAQGESALEYFTRLDPQAVVVALAEDFSTREAGEAGRELLARVRQLGMA